MVGLYHRQSRVGGGSFFALGSYWLRGTCKVVLNFILVVEIVSTMASDNFFRELSHQEFWRRKKIYFLILKAI